MDNSSLSTSFDFNSQAGVMAVLAAIRQSTLTPPQKNELRDLVFLYANGGGDASVRLSLEQKISAYQIKPVAAPVVAKVEPTPEPAVVLPFGSSRPAPTFTAPVAAPVLKTAPVQAPEPVSVASPVPAPVAEATKSAESVVVPPPSVPVAELPLNVAPAPKVVSVPVAAPVAPTTKNQSEPLSIPAAFSDVNTNYLDRIREIKTAVNSKVGNPVNLVDIDNAVGREYMNALLDAMKRLSGGAGQIDPAMQRLEVAYQAVEVAVAAHQKTEANLETTVQNQTPIKETELVQSEVVNVPEPVIVKDPLPVVPVVAEEISLPPLPVEEVIKPRLEDVPTVSENDGRWNSPIAPESEVFRPVAEPVSVPVVPQTESFASAATALPKTQLSGVPAASVHPVAEAAPIHTPEDLPTAAMKAGKDADPLFAKEIDNGLEQLLSDWVLFKKSGLFGTGPKGREHPLFIKMAGLPIPLLLAGRFEGSTQEIKQSVTDYMNGWRYEQGIIYEQGETFEHYLRRVIKQILDLQKKQRAS